MSYLYMFGTLLFFSSINGYSNSKVKYGLTLFTKDDCFQIAYETEDDRDSWLMTMRALISTHRDAPPMFRKCWPTRWYDTRVGCANEKENRLNMRINSVKPENTFAKKMLWKSTALGEAGWFWKIFTFRLILAFHAVTDMCVQVCNFSIIILLSLLWCVSIWDICGSCASKKRNVFLRVWYANVIFSVLDRACVECGYSRERFG